MSATPDKAKAEAAAKAALAAATAQMSEMRFIVYFSLSE